MAEKRSVFLPVLLLVEIVLVTYAYLSTDGIQEAIRLSARWSGRLSFVVFIYALLQYAQNGTSRMEKLHNTVIAFCFIHFIHLFLLWQNVELNHVRLIPYKLVGGALAYAMILAYPFTMKRIQRHWVHLVYYLYVSFVMLMTFKARLTGEFDGAEASIDHWVGIGSKVIAVFYLIYRSRDLPKREGA